MLNGGYEVGYSQDLGCMLQSYERMSYIPQSDLEPESTTISLRHYSQQHSVLPFSA
jgi:hypothetical protein